MERVADAEDVAERVGGRQGDGRGADDRRIQQEEILTLRHFEQLSNVEVAERRSPLEGVRGREHDGCRADDHHECADDGIRSLVRHPSRGDALVDHVRLLEEELPGCHRGANDADDQQ